MLVDARSVDDGAELSCDVCVVGAGPAGISIADRLRRTDLSICLIESGGFEPDLPTQRLYRGASTGVAYYPLDACRFRMFGGTSNRWGGWCRPLDPLDFESREWVDRSGWPIDHTEVHRFGEDAAALLELPSARFDLPAWEGRLPAAPPLDGGEFEHVIYQYSPRTNFAAAYGGRLLSARSVRTFVWGSVTDLQLPPGARRLSGVRVQTLSGRSFTVQARAVVLAAGAIENARLLLACTDTRPRGIGNEHDLVGRYFMEHLHVPVGHVVSPDGAFDTAFYQRARYGAADARGAVSPTAEAQRRRRLLACSITIERDHYVLGTPYLGWSPEITFRALAAYRQAQAGRGAERIRAAAESSWRRWRRLTTMWHAYDARSRAGHAASTSVPLHSLYVRSEQAPNRDSRVLLGSRRDALRMPVAELEWRIAERDTSSILAWLTLLDRTLDSRRLGRIIMPRTSWRNRIVGGPHHMGTTRMSDDPRAGVVDRNCRVHSVENLYVAGSSVFATGGYANPTFTLLALALRLADHLGTSLTRRERLPARPLAQGPSSRL